MEEGRREVAAVPSDIFIFFHWFQGGFHGGSRFRFLLFSGLKEGFAKDFYLTGIISIFLGSRMIIRRINNIECTRYRNRLYVQMNRVKDDSVIG